MSLRPYEAEPRIVDDLIPLILESNDHWWPRDLQRLALVSPGWRLHVARRLYACPVLPSFKACSQLARTLTENPQIQKLIQGIELRPMMRSSASRVVDETSMAGLRRLLALQNLQRVILGGELAAEAERFLNALMFADTITDLHIDGSDLFEKSQTSSGQEPSLEWDECIAFKFPRLRRFTLSNISLVIIPPSIKYPFQLTTLVLRNVHLVDGDLTDLCHHSWDHLISIKYETVSLDPIEGPIDELLTKCSRLEALHFDAPQSSISLPWNALLRELHLTALDMTLSNIRLIARSCPNLEHLSVSDSMVQISTEDWVACFQANMFPCLKTFTVPLNIAHGTCCQRPRRTLAILRSVCSERNILLTVRIL